MTALAVIFIIISICLFLFVLLQRREIRSISRQMKEINPHVTNMLVHSSGGDKNIVSLINDINNLIREIQQTRIQYQQKSHTLDQMMTNISHDLRTPLTSAMGYINIVKNSDMSDEEKSHEIEIIEQRLIRLEELINSFFEFSKVISEGRTPEMEKLNLTAVLEESISHYYDDYCSQNREIIFNCECVRINTFSNRNMLMRIFDNLISNALKHGTGNLSVSVSVSEMITIKFENENSDSDIEIDRIFDEFYTTDISRSKGNTGLGLSIAKQFTHMLDGKINAEYNGKLFSVTAEFPKYPDIK